jgi:nucleoid-associated protein YgaU
MKKLTDKEREKLLEERKKEIIARREAAKPKLITTYTVTEDTPTLSHISLKFYGHATKPYWMYLLEHNTEALKGSEKRVRIGMQLEIPELPDELKD